MGDYSQVLLIAHQNQTVDALNTLARQTLADNSALKGPSALAAGKEHRAGESVICLKAGPDSASSTATSPQSPQSTPTTKKSPCGWTATRDTLGPPDWYLAHGYLDYGYAVTGHKGQGVTARIAHAVTTGNRGYRP